MTNPIRIGDRIRDCDKRATGITLVVKGFCEKERIVGQTGQTVRVMVPAVVASLHGGDDRTFETRIRLDRIHTHGKPRKSGWEWVP